MLFMVLTAFALLSDSLLTLTEAEQTAVERAFQVRIENEQRESQQWSYWNAVGSFLPSVRATSQYIRLGEGSAGSFVQGGPTDPGGGEVPQDFVGQLTDETSIPQSEISSSNLFIHELTVEQPVINGGSRIIALRLAGVGRAAVRVRAQATRQDAILETRTAYFDAVAARARQNVAQRSIELAQRNLEQAQIRLDAGVAPITEVLRWKALVAENEAALTQAATAVETSRLALLLAMGYPPDTSLPQFDLETVDDFSGRCTTAVTLSVDDVSAVRGNPTIRVLERTTEIARYRRTLSLTRYFPSLNAFYTARWEALGELFPGEGGSWYAGIILSIPLFTGFTTTTSYLSERAEYRKAQIEFEQGRAGIVNQAVAAARAYQGSRDQVRAAAQQRRFIEQTLSVMQQRYENGIASLTDLLDVSVNTDRARLSYIQAVFDCLTAYARYQRSIGNLNVWGQ